MDSESAYTSMQSTLQDALDDLVSSRSSSNRQSRSLAALEHLLALACLSKNETDDDGVFFALQDTFECNVPSRLLGWVSASTERLDHVTNKGSMDSERELEASLLSSQLAQCLSIIQGVVLNHSASKRYLGRRHALEVFLDLLLASRHVSTVRSNSAEDMGSPARASPQSVPLSSVVLDTLLCILVDSSPALRVFEENNGVQVVVKLLKRAGTPREVRMKCLEFLYFYLIDETLPWMQQAHPTPVTPAANSSPFSSHPSYPRIAPSSPFRVPRQASPRHPKRLPNKGDGITPLATPTSLTRTPSPSSNDATSSFITAAGQSSRSHAPSYTESALPPYTATLQAPAQLCGISMLRKEINFVPVSPRKPASSRSPQTASGMRRHRKAMDSMSLSDVDGASVQDCDSSAEEKENMPFPQSWPFGTPSEKIHSPLRTTDQKKELLGELLGNVDALVEGVRKAGIWGLG